MTAFLGSGLLLFSAWYISLLLIRRHHNNLLATEAFVDMIVYIRDNIDHFSKPLPDIFHIYRNTYLETTGFLPNVRRSDLRQAWQEQSFSFPDDIDNLLDNFIQTIGSGYRPEELRLCDYTLERLRKQIEHLHTDSVNRIKLYKTVPIMLALSLILLLL